MAAAALVAVAACGSDGTADPDPLGTPQAGGILRLGLLAEPPSLDPFTTSNVAAAWGNLLSAIYDPLIWVDPDTGSLRPHIAESLVPDRTNKTWTMSLRSDVVFSDGAPFDAEAVKANWQVHADPKTGSGYASGLAGVKLTVVDPLHLRIELPAENANFDRIVANGLNFVASPRALRDVVKLRTNPVGAGPFVLTGREPGKSLTLSRNPRYWQPGRPYLDGIDVRVLASDREVPDRVAAGDIDLGEVVDAQLAKSAEDRRLGIIRLQLDGGLMVVFNTRKPPFDDPAARKAVVDSLSSAEINRLFYGGVGTPAHGIFDSTSPLANIHLAAPENNPERARAAFDQLTAGGTRPFTFSLLTAPRVADGEAPYIQRQVQRFPKVAMNIELVDVGTLSHRLLAGDFDAALSALWMVDPEPNLFDFLHPGIPPNVTGYTSTAVTAAMTAGRLTTDPVRRREAYTQAQIQLNQDMPYWVYQEATSAIVFDPQVTGIEVFGDGLVLFDRVGFRA